MLPVHAESDRPPGFDRVIELPGNRATRPGEPGQLDRIRSGVRQSMGHKGLSRKALAMARLPMTPDELSAAYDVAEAAEDAAQHVLLTGR